ncbi:hypothetical protein DVQ45_07850 [Yersinia enterocolitica]|nr:hypothetical protein [Yersinia enterocolitica]
MHTCLFTRAPRQPQPQEELDRYTFHLLKIEILRFAENECSRVWAADMSTTDKRPQKNLRRKIPIPYSFYMLIVINNDRVIGNEAAVIKAS